MTVAYWNVRVVDPEAPAARVLEPWDPSDAPETTTMSVESRGVTVKTHVARERRAAADESDTVRVMDRDVPVTELSGVPLFDRIHAAADFDSLSALAESVFDEPPMETL